MFDKLSFDAKQSSANMTTNIALDWDVFVTRANTWNYGLYRSSVRILYVAYYGTAYTNISPRFVWIMILRCRSATWEEIIWMETIRMEWHFDELLRSVLSL